MKRENLREVFGALNVVQKLIFINGNHAQIVSVNYIETWKGGWIKQVMKKKFFYPF